MYTFDIKPIEDVSELSISDTDIVLARDVSQGNALKRATFGSMATFIRGKLSDLVESIARNTRAIATLQDAYANIPTSSGIPQNIITGSIKPVVRPNGLPLRIGDLWIDISNNFVWHYSGNVWRSDLQNLQLDQFNAHVTIPPRSINCYAYLYREFCSCFGVDY